MTNALVLLYSQVTSRSIQFLMAARPSMVTTSIIVVWPPSIVRATTIGRTVWDGLGEGDG